MFGKQCTRANSYAQEVSRRNEGAPAPPFLYTREIPAIGDSLQDDGFEGEESVDDIRDESCDGKYRLNSN